MAFASQNQPQLHRKEAFAISKAMVIKMRITLEADYALRIMCQLQRHGEVMDAGSIAASASVPPRFTLKILRKLQQGGLVCSKKGASGGYRLNMSAAPFTLRCVIELIDGPLAISKCVDGNCGCSMLGDDKSECAIHHIFQAISEDLSEKLGRITIADVTESNADIGALINKLNGAHGTAKYDMRRQRY